MTKTMIALASLVAVLQLGCGVPTPSKSSVKRAANQTQRRANRTAGSMVRHAYSRADAIATKNSAGDSVDVDPNDLDADVADFARPNADDLVADADADDFDGAADVGDDV